MQLGIFMEEARHGGTQTGAFREALELAYDEILGCRVVFGTAGSVIARLAELRERLGLDCVAAELNPGGLIPEAQAKRTLRVLAHEVKPALA